MNQRWIYKDEWSPVYTLENDDGHRPNPGPFDLTDEELVDYERVMTEFWEWQSKLEEMHDPKPNERQLEEQGPTLPYKTEGGLYNPNDWGYGMGFSNPMQGKR